MNLMFSVCESGKYSGSVRVMHGKTKVTNNKISVINLIVSLISIITFVNSLVHETNYIVHTPPPPPSFSQDFNLSQKWLYELLEGQLTAPIGYATGRQQRADTIYSTAKK